MGGRARDGAVSDWRCCACVQCGERGHSLNGSVAKEPLDIASAMQYAQDQHIAAFDSIQYKVVANRKTAYSRT